MPQTWKCCPVGQRKLAYRKNSLYFRESELSKINFFNIWIYNTYFWENIYRGYFLTDYFFLIGLLHCRIHILSTCLTVFTHLTHLGDNFTSTWNACDVLWLWLVLLWLWSVRWGLSLLHRLLPYPLTLSRSNTWSLTDVAFKIIVRTYATFQDCDKDCNSFLDMQLVTWSMTQLPIWIGTLWWYQVVVELTSMRTSLSKEINSRNAHSYLCISQVRNTCSPLPSMGTKCSRGCISYPCS